MLTLILFVIGLGLLLVGAELLVRGASRLALAVGLSPLVVGLTVVAFGTSSPELAVSVNAALSGQPDIAIGNVVGSNIFNVLFILGISALIVPLVVHRQLVVLDVPLMIGVSAALWWMASDGQVSRLDGVLLLVGLAGYVAVAVVVGRRDAQREAEERKQQGSPASAGPDGVAGSTPDGAHASAAATEPATAASQDGQPLSRRLLMDIGLIVVGLVLLVIGAQWLVNGAIEIARYLGLSELVIGLTIVAAGTSLPEVATSIMAAIRGQRDIAVGNVVGSNIFNILGILGITALVAPVGVAPAVMNFDLPFMVAVAVACLPIFFSAHSIDRWEGVVFLLYYVVYTAYLLLAATQHDALGSFSTVMFVYVTPLIALTILAVAMHQRGKPRVPAN